MECCLKDLDLAGRAAWCLKLGVTVISTLSSGILNLLDLYIFNSFIYLVVPLAGHALSVAWDDGGDAAEHPNLVNRPSNP